MPKSSVKRYIFDEVATFEEATRDPYYKNVDFRYCMDYFGTLTTRQLADAGKSQWLKLIVLEGSPEAIAEAMIMIGNNHANNRQEGVAA